MGEQTPEFDPAYASTARTADEALELARAWADGRRSWMNLGPHEPYTPDVIAAMDAQEVVKWGALAQALGARDLQDAQWPR